MYCYRDITFCVNKECLKECSIRLTKEIEKSAERAGMRGAEKIL